MNLKILSGMALIFVVACTRAHAPMLTAVDREFLSDLTRVVIDSSRILPGEDLPSAIRSYGPNQSGITLIKPGGRDCYPSFWIRDYALSLESGFITDQEQLDILLFTAARQSDSTWTTKTRSLVPVGSIPDHIRLNDGLPVYFPGTYDFVYQGNDIWRRPPYGDQYFFIHMAWFYYNKTGDVRVLKRIVNDISLFERLELAFLAVPANAQTGMVFISDTMPTCDFGFRDIVSMTGEVCFGSLLRYRAALEMARLYEEAGSALKSDSYKAVASKIKSNLLQIFADGRGMLRASTGKSAQPDVWATAFAVYIGALEGPDAKLAGEFLAKAYAAGTLSYNGQIRHVLNSDDYDSTTAWEKAGAAKNSYQNGAYWGTPTGWVCYTIDKADPTAARRLAAEYVADLRKSDFRLPGRDQGGPYECVYPPSGYRQNPVYMTTVTCPFAVFRDKY